MSRRRKIWKPLARFGKSISSGWKQASKGTNSTLSKLTSFSEQPLVVGGSVTRRRPNYANFVNPLFWINEAFWFVARYLKSRNLVAGIQGAPAVLGMVAPLMAAFWFSSSANDQTIYATARMNYHVNRGQLDEADFYARKLCFLAPDNPDVLLARAQLLGQMDREDEAQAIALQLASERESVAAVEWLSEKELQDIRSSDDVDPERDRQLERWLTWIINRDPEHFRANFMLGTLRMMRGQHVTAIPPFRTVANGFLRAGDRDRHLLPETWYSLALCYKATGATEESQANASLAADAFLERDALSTFDIRRTLRTLQALIMAAREPEAALLIEEAIPRQQKAGELFDVERLKWLLGEVYAQQCKRLRSKDRRQARDVAEAVEALYKGLAAAPKNPVVEEELIAFACSKDIGNDNLEQQLTVAQDSGVSPGLIHFIRGTRAITSVPPDTEAAKQQFKLAQAHNPDYPGLLNNLADAMAESEDADLSVALQLVNEALEMMPGQPHFHDTRGKILLRMGRTVDAVTDFENALAAPEIRETVHTSLAKAWRKLGNETEAARHENQAELIRQQNELEGKTLSQPPDQQTADPSP